MRRSALSAVRPSVTLPLAQSCLELEPELRLPAHRHLDVLAGAVAVLTMIHAGSTLTIIAAICVVARAQARKRPVLRALLPNRFETNTDLLLTTETLVRDQLRRELQQRQQGDSTERGPPRCVA